MTINSVSRNNNPTSDLDCIRDKISTLQRSYEQSFLEIGRLLLQAKNLFGKYGNWTSWLESNTELSVSKAQRLMKVAKLFQNTTPAPYLTYTKAYILTALQEKDFDSFLASTHYLNGKSMRVEDMSKRELQTAVHNYLLEKKSKSDVTRSSKKSSTTLTSEDILNECITNIKNSVHKFMKLVQQQNNTSGTNEVFVEKLRDLCTQTIEKLPTEELEDI